MKGLQEFDRIQKGYVFISHSHNDIDKVRKIRNFLEEEGFEPLCFYLKCLNDDSEIEELIKREIDAREWFVFVDSENSRKSKWVQLEREYIRKTDKKKIITLEIDNPDSCNKTVDKILHNLRVCVVSSGRDYQVSARFQSALEKKDYLVFGSRNFNGEQNFWQQTKRAVVKAAKEGLVIALLSEASMKSAYISWEILTALKKGGNVIPVLLGDAELSEEYAPLLSNREIYRLSYSPTDEEITDVIDQIGKGIVSL